MQLRSERLVLRPHTVEDWSAVYGYAHHPDVLRYRPDPVRTREETQAHLHQLVAAQQRDPRTSYHVAIVLQSNTRLIGWCSLSLKDPMHRVAELGYDLDHREWNNGYVTEAVRVIIQFGFASLGLHRIFAECHPENGASQRVMEKVQMTYEGHLRENIWLKGSWWDTLVYGLLAHEWTTAHS